VSAPTNGGPVAGPVVWVDGRLAPAAEASVAALDHGLTVGDGVFETCKVVHGRPFALSRHLRRLETSARVLGLTVPPGIRDAVEAVLAVTHLPLGRLRITVTGGAGPLGSSRGTGGTSLVVAAAPAEPWPSRIAAITVTWTRNENSAVAGAKTTSYAENVVALRAAHRASAHEALLANTRGELCEGTGTNVVLAFDGRLVTPPLSSGCLAGITRELLLEWSEQAGTPIEQRALTMAELAGAEGVLLTSSTRDVQPVAELDGRSLSQTSASRAAVALFARRAAENVDP
jgi:branched-chain amino acid aminotransferase